MTEQLKPEISARLLGKIIDEVFNFAIEDPSVIEDIYRAIASDVNSRADSQPGQQEPVKDERDWQAECLKKGFEYVRESDDHYVIASPAEMVALLRDLLGIDVRQKNGRDYGVAVCELQEQIDGLVNTLHSKLTDRPAQAGQQEPVAVLYADGTILSRADCGGAFDICCRAQTPLYLSPQPSPDAAALVEALEFFVNRAALIQAIFDLWAEDAADALRLKCKESKELIAAYRAHVVPTPPQRCVWSHDHDSGAYESACGKTWHYSDGGTPEENGQLYCHGCGKPIDDSLEVK